MIETEAVTSPTSTTEYADAVAALEPYRVAELNKAFTTIWRALEDIRGAFYEETDEVTLAEMDDEERARDAAHRRVRELFADAVNTAETLQFDVFDDVGGGPGTVSHLADLVDEQYVENNRKAARQRRARRKKLNVSPGASPTSGLVLRTSGQTFTYNGGHMSTTEKTKSEKQAIKEAIDMAFPGMSREDKRIVQFASENLSPEELTEKFTEKLAEKLADC